MYSFSLVFWFLSDKLLGFLLVNNRDPTNPIFELDADELRGDRYGHCINFSISFFKQLVWLDSTKNSLRNKLPSPKILFQQPSLIYPLCQLVILFARKSKQTSFAIVTRPGFYVYNYRFWMSNQIHHVLPPFLVSFILLLSLFSFYHLRLNFFTRQPSFEWSRSFLFEKSRKAQTRDV